MYLQISCHDYKGGELGTPELYSTLNEILESQEDIWYVETPIGNIKDFKVHVKKWLESIENNIYAGAGTAYKFYKMVGIKVQYMNAKYFMKNLDFESLFKFYREEIV